MKIILSTRVLGHYKKIFQGFDLDLFKALAPPLLPMRILMFEGCEKGDNVKLETGLIFKEVWHSVITANNQTDKTIWFVDEGKELPFPLKRWKHQHLLLNQHGLHTDIVDNIEYSTGWLLTDALVYPFLYAMFWYRKPVYKKYFMRYFADKNV